MGKKGLILWALFLFLAGAAAAEFEKYIASGRMMNGLAVQSRVVQYSFSRIPKNAPRPFRNVTSSLFKTQPRLVLLIVLKKGRVLFTASRSPAYSALLSGLLNRVKKDPGLSPFSMGTGKDRYVFHAINTEPFKIITGSAANLDFKKLYLRNGAMALLAFFLILLWSRKKRTASEKEIKPPVREKSILPEIDNFKDLYQENIRLNENMEHLAMLREVGNVINSAGAFDEMLRSILDLLLANMSVRKAVIYLIDEDKKGLTGKIGKESRGILEEEDLKMSHIILDRGPEGKALALHQYALGADDTGKGYLTAPLVARGDLIGAIRVEGKPDDGSFTEKEAEALRLFSSHIAIALNNARLYEMAITDGLTRLYVHRHFQHKIHEEIQRHKRTRHPLSLLMFDIDHFKSFNDEYGHQAGDYVLREISKISRSLYRSTDSIFRYGGEEIAVLLPETDPENAYMLGEKLRKTIEEHNFFFGNESFRVTVSQGISTFEPGRMKELSKEKMIGMADEALYFSKNNGRNRTTLYKSDLSLPPSP